MTQERDMPREDAEGDMWRTIESAPRDGTLIDLWFITDHKGNGRREANVWWNRHEGFWYRLDRTACIYGRNATHWMPLPTPPGRKASPTPSIPSVEE